MCVCVCGCMCVCADVRVVREEAMGEVRACVCLLARVFDELKRKRECKFCKFGEKKVRESLCEEEEMLLLMVLLSTFHHLVSSRWRHWSPMVAFCIIQKYICQPKLVTIVIFILVSLTRSQH